MDIKKLYDFEYMLENMRPEFTEAELLDTAGSSEDKLASEVVSVNVTTGANGIYLKTVDKDGNHGALQNLNPIVAESLAFELLGTLKSMGAEHLDFATNDVAPSKSNLH